MTERKISSMQFSMLLFTALVGASLTQAMQTEDHLALLLGMVLSWLILLPAFFLFRRRGLFSALRAAGKPLLLLVVTLLFLLCLLFAAQSIRAFSYFMTFTVYPAASGGIFLISMALVCAYGAGMGLESLARFSLWTVVLAVVSLLAFAGGSVSLLRTAHWQGMFSQSAVSVLSRAGSILLRTGETLLFLLLFARVREQRPAKTAAGGFLFAGIFTSAAALLVIGAVGQYAENLRFPLQTIASAAHFSPQGRMDLLYLFFFVFLVFTRAALWLYGACYCLRHLFPKLRRGMCAVLCGAAAAGLGFLSVLPQVMQWLLSGGVVGLVILLPLLLLLVKKGGRVS